MRHDLATLIILMESVSPTCTCSVDFIRGTDRVQLWWVSGKSKHLFECGNARAHVGNPKFVHALKQARIAMN